MVLREALFKTLSNKIFLTIFFAYVVYILQRRLGQLLRYHSLK